MYFSSPFAQRRGRLGGGRASAAEHPPLTLPRFAREGMILLNGRHIDHIA